MKKMLMTASVPSMIGQFNMNNIEILQNLEYQVHIACNFSDRSVWTDERVEQFKNQMREMNVVCHQVEFSRSPLNIKKNFSSYRQVCELIRQERFCFIHCHTPVAGVISRMAAHKCRIKVIYTAHGFHFYKGAPLKNWLLYFPIEKILSRWTDVLITITKEDYNRAKKKFNACKTVYVPGIGVDIDKFSNVNADRISIRTSLGLKQDDIMLLSVGELNENKNHSIVIKSLGALQDSKIHYYIAGTGTLKDLLIRTAEDNNVGDKVHLLGYRTDIPELLKSADIYVLPSIREGLNVSLMEAMASGLPCICGNIRGNTDLIESGIGGYLVSPTNEDEYCACIKRIINPLKSKTMSEYNQRKIKKFGTSVVKNIMEEIYINL